LLQITDSKNKTVFSDLIEFPEKNNNYLSTIIEKIKNEDELYTLLEKKEVSSKVTNLQLAFENIKMIKTLLENCNPEKLIPLLNNMTKIKDQDTTLLKYVFSDPKLTTILLNTFPDIPTKNKYKQSKEDPKIKNTFLLETLVDKDIYNKFSENFDTPLFQLVSKKLPSNDLNDLLGGKHKGNAITEISLLHTVAKHIDPKAVHTFFSFFAITPCLNDTYKHSLLTQDLYENKNIIEVLKKRDLITQFMSVFTHGNATTLGFKLQNFL